MKKDYKWIALAIIIQLVICLFVGIHKKSFFCDEIYSYGLANCTQYMFLDPASAEEYSSTGWVDERYFKQYVEVGSSQKLSFEAPIQNQKMDVHPPLYYCLLHLVCYLFRGSFSKWTGLGLNGMILVLIDFVILYIAYYLYRDMKKAILAMLLWSCSAAGLSNILFIRMYLLLTCIILVFAALHVRYIENRMALRKKDYAILGLLVTVGGLTHYYFYPFVFFFSGVVCIYLFYRRRMVEMIKYGSALIAGFLLALVVFPSTLRHVVGYRGDEVLTNLSGREENVLLIYLHWINQSIFGGYVKCFILIFAAIVFWKLFNQYLFHAKVIYSKSSQEMVLYISKAERKRTYEYHLKIKRESVFFMLFLFSSIMFGIIAAKGSQIINNRYIYPVYPAIAFFIIAAAIFCLRQTVGKRYENPILLVVIALLCILSIRSYGIDFLYSDYDSFKNQAEPMRGKDCLLLYGDEWLDVYTALPLKEIYDETYFLHPDEIEKLPEILCTRKTEDPVVVCLPDNYTSEDAEKVLGAIMVAGGWTEYQMIYQYYTQAYFMQ